MQNKIDRSFLLQAGCMLVMALVAVFLGISTAKFLTKPILTANGENIPPAKMDEIVGGKVFVLIAGVDKSEKLTDVLMVLCYNEENKHIRVMSVPRDTYVYYDSNMYYGYKRAPINEAYSRVPKKTSNGQAPPTGIEHTALKVKELLGIPAINYYAIFKVGTFAALIDELDGVDFYVPQNMHYDDPNQDLHIHLNKGQQKLTGQMAENMVRYRKYNVGDIKRVEVQQDLFMAILEQKLNKSYIGKIDEVYNVLKEKVISDITPKDLLGYADDALSLKMENVQMCTMPVEFITGDSHVNPIQEEIDKLVPEFFELDDTKEE